MIRRYSHDPSIRQLLTYLFTALLLTYHFITLHSSHKLITSQVTRSLVVVVVIFLNTRADTPTPKRRPAKISRAVSAANRHILPMHTRPQEHTLSFAPSGATKYPCFLPPSCVFGSGDTLLRKVVWLGYLLTSALTLSMV